MEAIVGIHSVLTMERQGGSKMPGKGTSGQDMLGDLCVSVWKRQCVYCVMRMRGRAEGQGC